MGLEIDQVRQLKQLQEENQRLKRLVADLTLDKTMLQDVLANIGQEAAMHPSEIGKDNTQLAARISGIGGWAGLVLGLWLGIGAAAEAYRNNNDLGLVVWAALCIPLALFMMRAGSILLPWVWNLALLILLIPIEALRKMLILAVLLTLPASAAAQFDADLAMRQIKDVRLVTLTPIEGLGSHSFRGPQDHEPLIAEMFGVRLLLGGVYEPIAFEDERWIMIGCQSNDPRIAWDEHVYGFPLHKVHALIYERDEDGDLDVDGRIATEATEEYDEGICDLGYGLDRSFLTIPKDFDPAHVVLYGELLSGQYVQVVETQDRAIILSHIDSSPGEIE